MPQILVRKIEAKVKSSLEQRAIRSVILLDTNVISAVMSVEPDRRVANWLDRQPRHELWTTSITLFELELGIELLAEGRRRRTLEVAFAAFVDEDLEGRLLDFDALAAGVAARIASGRRRAGRPVEVRDTQVAAIALSRNAALATRNLRHFDDVGLTLFDPWSEGAASRRT